MTTINEIDTAIASLEAKQARPIREFQLNPQDALALARIQDIDRQVQALRQERDDLVTANLAGG